MNKLYRILILLVIVAVIWKGFSYFDILSSKQTNLLINDEFDTVESQANKVIISVYYEALCPDSKFFITYQLLHTYEKLQKYIILDLVPYGKAQTIEEDGKIAFVCQHNAVECEANKIHACAIDQIKEQLLIVRYIACMITDNIIPEEAGERCAQELNIDYTPISNCAKSTKGSILLKKFGERTHNLSPAVHFIPTIELNGSQSLVSQTMILKDLTKALCELFDKKPRVCV